MRWQSLPGGSGVQVCADSLITRFSGDGSVAVGWAGVERLDPQCGPFGTLWQAYSSGLDALAKSSEPAAVGISRWQLELMALTLRRTQAWLETPARLGRCRTAQDLLGEQL